MPTMTAAAPTGDLGDRSAVRVGVGDGGGVAGEGVAVWRGAGRAFDEGLGEVSDGNERPCRAARPDCVALAVAGSTGAHCGGSTAGIVPGAGPVVLVGVGGTDGAAPGPSPERTKTAPAVSATAKTTQARPARSHEPLRPGPAVGSSVGGPSVPSGGGPVPGGGLRTRAGIGVRSRVGTRVAVGFAYAFRHGLSVAGGPRGGRAKSTSGLRRGGLDSAEDAAWSLTCLGPS
jgi:hypothetical protein